MEQQENEPESQTPNLVLKHYRNPEQMQHLAGPEQPGLLTTDEGNHVFTKNQYINVVT